jgi:hypothetical protein
MEDEMKFYVYVSTTKVDMLYEQIPAKTRDKIATELKIDLKVVSTTFSEAPAEPTRFSKLKLVTEFIEKNAEVGTVDQPRSFFSGTMDMKWGAFNRHGQPTGLVYFGGMTDHTVLGLGGSEKHVIGGIGNSEATASASLMPVLIRILSSEFPYSDDLASTARDDDPVSHGTLLAVRNATEKMRGPSQNLEFLAKRLVESREIDEDDKKTVLLGSPIYVALVE